MAPSKQNIQIEGDFNLLGIYNKRLLVYPEIEGDRPSSSIVSLDDNQGTPTGSGSGGSQYVVKHFVIHISSS